MLLWIAFVAGLTSTPALADEPEPAEEIAPYVTRVIPGCKLFDVPMIGQVCGYQFLDDWKTVAAADAELVLRRGEVLALAQARDAERDRADVLAEALRLREDMLGHLVAELDTERGRLIDLDRKYQKERGAPWHAWVGWGVATVAVSALAGVLLAETN